MRFVSRLHLCAIATIVMIFYFTWVHQSDYFESKVQAMWQGNTHRIVVFGNDWSDTRSYRVSSPASSEIAPRDIDRGEVWVETLCKELQCDAVDNFARSIPSDADTVHVGSLIDSILYEQAKGAESNGIQMTTDFKTQVRQFLTYDKGRRHIPRRFRKVENEWTVFTVFFGLWELMEYSSLEKQYAMLAIENSIEKLFQNLDVLAAEVDFPLKVVVPRMVDVTILPRFQSTKNATQEQFAETQHLLVFLWSYWNTVLLQTATQWAKGQAIVPDPNTLIVEQVRVGQLHSKQISDASGTGKQAPLFQYVEQPCLASKPNDGAPGLQTAAVEKCEDPSQHLFWDDIHLSGNVNRLIGEQAASLIRENQTVNIEAMQGSANTQESKTTEGANFGLRFPPGY
ncbi:hypothetical protein T440DRAFT_148277 [Plenodomus tracheiphilus IPT5]|uniref:Carbohydrate esterase family 16 protein n=1 Tax=Plenodomus tracheiphilus IPT5 TaxID=1408161 RepID=A0A6A7B2F2_9PLEO|nr:hypothetical protein T440DRAFT_148277 [Plenodomus tracheiphilus IPT5]